MVNVEVKDIRRFALNKIKCDPRQYPQMLEDHFPHVLITVATLWDTGQCEDYLNDLLKPNGSGGRQERKGFPEQAWYEIFGLLTIYRKPRLMSNRQTLAITGKHKKIPGPINRANRK